MQSASAAVEAAGISHVYGSVAALDHVDLSIKEGESFALLGPNGGGKTTLFRILSTLMAPCAGHARVCGRDTVADAAGVRELTGVVFQSPSLDRKLSARENLWCHGRLHGLGRAELRGRVAGALERAGLAKRAGDAVEHFSGGMMRRVEVAKALLTRPRVLLMDEPSTGLDPLARRGMHDALDELRRAEGVTVVLTTHLMDEAARCGRVAIIDRGRIAAAGTPRELVEAVGGEVLSVEAADGVALAEYMDEKFGLPLRWAGDDLRVEVPGERGTAAAMLQQMTREVPEMVRGARVGLPTLEDAFLHFAGRTFGEAEAGAAPTVGAAARGRERRG